MIEYLQNFVALFTESAPWLLLGLLIAGLMKWFVPIKLLEKHMGDNKVSSIVKAALIGAPLPLCSCGVIPAAIGLRRAGASRSTTVSFLISTPETGVDSISVSYALLGPFFAIIRPFAAIFTAIYAGLMVKIFALKESGDQKNSSKIIESSDSSCCSSNKKEVEIAKSCCDVPKKEDKITASSSCCSSTDLDSKDLNQQSSAVTDQEPASSSCSSEKPQETPQKLTFWQLLTNALAFASGKLLSDITKWLLIGLSLAAAIQTWVSTDFLLQWGDGLVAMLVMALIGIPMYICATASTPLAAGFLAAGLSPGAILVFMLAGPATNIATMGMIRQEMGNSVLIAYLGSLFTASIGFGYLTNWLIAQYHFVIPIVATDAHSMNSSFIYPIAAVLLAGLMVRNWLK